MSEKKIIHEDEVVAFLNSWKNGVINIGKKFTENDDFIEVLDMLHEERRVWVDWEENSYTKRGYSRMIYYTNICQLDILK